MKSHYKTARALWEFPVLHKQQQCESQHLECLTIKYKHKTKDHQLFKENYFYIQSPRQTEQKNLEKKTQLKA